MNKFKLAFLLCFFFTTLSSQISFDTIAQASNLKVNLFLQNYLIVNDKSNAPKSYLFDFENDTLRVLNSNIYSLSVKNECCATFLDKHFLSDTYGKIGIIDSNEKEIIPASFDFISSHSKNQIYFPAMRNDSCFVIGLDGSINFLGLGHNARKATILDNNRVVIKTNLEEYLVYNVEGDLLIESKELILEPTVHPDFILAKKKEFGSPYFLMDYNEKIIIQPKVTCPFANSNKELIQFRGELGSEITLTFDYQGNKVPSNKYRHPPYLEKVIGPKGFGIFIYFKETDYYMVYKNKKTGIVDREGKIIIPFENSKNFKFTKTEKGVFFIVNRQNSGIHIYDEKGNLILEGDYTSFQNSSSMRYSRQADKEEKYGSDGNNFFLQVEQRVAVVNMKGEEIIPPIYKSIYPRKDNRPSEYLVVKTQDNDTGLVNKDGEIILFLGKYKSITNINDSYFLLTDNENRLGIYKIVEE